MTTTDARITDEALAALRKRIGVETPIEDPFNAYASKDAIRHFARGVGDTNPLWQDEEYARKTRWNDIIAPPAFLYSLRGRNGGAAGVSAIGLAGVHGVNAGTEFEWYRPILAGERIISTMALTDVIEKQGQFAGRQVLQGVSVFYRAADGALVARAKAWSMRTERPAARERKKYSEVVPRQHTPDDIARIEADYDQETRRGSTPRYWEDVREGDSLGHVVKGPLTVTDMICWLIGQGYYPFLRAHRLALEYKRRHPNVYNLDSLGVPDVMERVHWDDAAARDVGAPGAYDFGPQRVSWLAHLLTNWMGDDAFLKSLSAQVRRFAIMGDTIWCKGRVVRKYVQGDHHLVDVEAWAENQRGENTAPGNAKIILPSRENGPVRIPLAADGTPKS